MGVSPKAAIAMALPRGMGVPPVCGTVFAAMTSLQTGETPVPPVKCACGAMFVNLRAF